MANIVHIAAGNDRSGMTAGSIKLVRGQYHIADPLDATHISVISGQVTLHPEDGTYSVRKLTRQGNPQNGTGIHYYIKHDVITYVTPL